MSSESASSGCSVTPRVCHASTALLRALGRAGGGRRQGPAAGSATLEGGLPRAVLKEAAHAVLLVLGGEQGGEVHPLDLQAGGQIDLEAPVDGLLGGPQRQRRAGRVLGDHVPIRPLDLDVRYDLVGQD